MNGYEYIRTYYDVPCKRGACVSYNGRKGRVTGTSGPHVRVRLDGETVAHPYHPKDLTWCDETPRR